VFISHYNGQELS